MARNTKIENPTRVAIATVEDQNKYLMSRNRNIDDQTNQFFDTNVAADINVQGKSSLMRLAESLREASPVIKEFIDRKEKEKELEDTSQASQDILSNNPKTIEEAQKQTEGKSLAYKKAYSAIAGNMFATESNKNIIDRFIKSPDKESVSIKQLIADEVVKNKGIKDPYFLTSFNQSIIPSIEKLTNIQTKISQENFLDESRTKLLTDLSTNKLSLSSVYENGRMLALGNSDIKQVVKKYAQDAADNGDLKTLDRLTKEALEYTDSKGFKPYAGEENEFGKMKFIALRNFGASLELEDKVRDTMLTKADNEEWKSTIPLLMEETDPSKIDQFKRGWKTRMISAGMSPEEIVKRERLIDSMLIPKEATVDQSVFTQKLILEFNSGKNPLGGNPIDTLEAMRREGLITGKQSGEIFRSLLSYKDQQVRESKQLTNQLNAEKRAEDRQRISIENENRRANVRNLRQTLSDSRRMVLNALDDSTTAQVMGLGTNNKSSNDILKMYGASSLADIESKYSLKINELNTIQDPKKQDELFQQIRGEMTQELTNQGLILNTVVPKFKKEYIDNYKAESLYVLWNIAKQKNVDVKDFIKNNNLNEKDLNALEIYAKNRSAFLSLKEISKQKETTQQQSQTNKRVTIKD